MAIQKFRVTGLTRGDEERVRQTLATLDGVLYVSVSPAEGCAEIEFEDDTVTTDALRSAFRSLGLDARLAG